MGAWSYAGLSFIGLGMTGIAIAAVPLCAAWLINCYWLGRKKETLAKSESAILPIGG